MIHSSTVKISDEPKDKFWDGNLCQYMESELPLLSYFISLQFCFELDASDILAVGLFRAARAGAGPSCAELEEVSARLGLMVFFVVDAYGLRIIAARIGV